MTIKRPFPYAEVGRLGVILSVVLSYTANQHIGWAIVHGILGWIYVLYRLLGYGV